MIALLLLLGSSLVLGDHSAHVPQSSAPTIKYGGPIVYSGEKPPIIHFPPPPAPTQGNSGFGSSRGGGVGGSPPAVKYIPLPHHDLPVLIYQSVDKPPIHVVHTPAPAKTPYKQPYQADSKPKSYPQPKPKPHQPKKVQVGAASSKKQTYVPPKAAAKKPIYPPQKKPIYPPQKKPIYPPQKKQVYPPPQKTVPSSSNQPLPKKPATNIYRPPNTNSETNKVVSYRNQKPVYPSLPTPQKFKSVSPKQPASVPYNGPPHAPSSREFGPAKAPIKQTYQAKPQYPVKKPYPPQKKPFPAKQPLVNPRHPHPQPSKPTPKPTTLPGYRPLPNNLPYKQPRGPGYEKPDPNKPPQAKSSYEFVKTTKAPETTAGPPPPPPPPRAVPAPSPRAVPPPQAQRLKQQPRAPLPKHNVNYKVQVPGATSYVSTSFGYKKPNPQLKQTYSADHQKPVYVKAPPAPAPVVINQPKPIFAKKQTTQKPVSVYTNKPNYGARPSKQKYQDTLFRSNAKDVKKRENYKHSSQHFKEHQKKAKQTYSPSKDRDFKASAPETKKKKPVKQNYSASSSSSSFDTPSYAPPQPSYKAKPTLQPKPKPVYNPPPSQVPHIIYAGHPPIHIYQQPPVQIDAPAPQPVYQPETKVYKPPKKTTYSANSPPPPAPKESLPKQSSYVATQKPIAEKHSTFVKQPSVKRPGSSSYKKPFSSFSQPKQNYQASAARPTFKEPSFTPPKAPSSESFGPPKAPTSVNYGPPRSPPKPSATYKEVKAQSSVKKPIYTPPKKQVYPPKKQTFPSSVTKQTHPNHSIGGDSIKQGFTSATKYQRNFPKPQQQKKPLNKVQLPKPTFNASKLPGYGHTKQNYQSPKSFPSHGTAVVKKPPVFRQPPKPKTPYRHQKPYQSSASAKSSPVYVPAPKAYHKPPIIIYQGVAPPVHVYEKPASNEYTPAQAKSGHEGWTVSNEQQQNQRGHLQTTQAKVDILTHDDLTTSADNSWLTKSVVVGKSISSSSSPDQNKKGEPRAEARIDSRENSSSAVVKARVSVGNDNKGQETLKKGTVEDISRE